MEKKEFSKKLLIVSWAVAVVLTALTVTLPMLTCADLQGLYIALPLSWGEVTAANGFYFWKSKNENRYKYTHKFVMELAEKHGVDAALRAAEITLKD